MQIYNLYVLFIVIRVWFKMTSASTSSSSAGVKRKALSIDDKLRIIKLYDEKIGVFNKQQIADQLRLPSSSLRTILKNRKEIEKNAFSGSTKRQKVRNGKNEQLENILLEWFRQARTLNLAVNGPVLTEKANEIAKRLNITDFGGSNGWLDRFRKRHGIVYRKICGEADAVDDNSIKSWKETILPNLEIPKINVLDAIHYVSIAWDEIKPEMTTN
ncbi:tigger transposable element-derived protein 4-like [Metopolophium dirhodum]|uniref:tigger transposable element-derived protein 4-like n=1 Tax=Metopolophium dirhodum TaxID=44670 RepID=UPI0029907E14|nr:tigger transposable element-derived protein 4-like [Metopolophium dirhodum]